MYGTRDAAANWEEEYSFFLSELGFVKGVASPCVFYHPIRNIRMMIHGDDFLATGFERELRKLVKDVESKYECKHELAGEARHLLKQIKVIGRRITFERDHLTIEVDPCYVADALRAYGMDECNKAVTPGVKEGLESKEERRTLLLKRVLGTKESETEPSYNIADPDDEALGEEDLRRYQSIAAKVNFVAPDRPEALYATKECMKSMSAPTKKSEERLKRLLRYFKGAPRAAIQMAYGASGNVLKTYVAADFAGCVKTRRSTSGGCIMWNGCLLKAWSKTIPTLALSSGESELSALAKGAAEGLGARSLFHDLGVEVSLEIHSDATAAIGIAARQGLGRIRHISVADLWVQQRLKAGDFRTFKIPGADNPSDLMTKPVGSDLIHKFLKILNVFIFGG